MFDFREGDSVDLTKRKGQNMLDAQPRCPSVVSHLADKPTELSVNSLIARLKSDLATRGLSPKNHAHRLRVIRQQAELLALNAATDVSERGSQKPQRSSKTSPTPDVCETGGEG